MVTVVHAMVGQNAPLLPMWIFAYSVFRLPGISMRTQQIPLISGFSVDNSEIPPDSSKAQPQKPKAERTRKGSCDPIDIVHVLVPAVG
jgi:hypothetical protein